MSLTATASATSSVAPIAEGTHFARCIQIIDLGTQYSERYDKHTRKVMLHWEVYDETYTTQDGKEEPRVIGATFTTSLSEKATLRAILESWRGKKFSDEELSGFYLGKLIGVPCMLSITHTERGGRTYANVSGAQALPKGVACPEQILESVLFEIEAPDAKTIMQKFPDFIQDMIESCDEWKDTTPAPVDESTDDDLPF